MNRRKGRIKLFFLMGLLALQAAEAPSAMGAPRLRVRGRCVARQVRSIQYMKEGNRQLVLTAAMQDLDTREPVIDLSLYMDVFCGNRRIRRTRVTTSQAGRLAVTVSACPSGENMEVRFSLSSTSDYILEEPHSFSINTAKRNVLLEVGAPRRAPFTGGEILIRVTARQEIRVDLPSSQDFSAVEEAGTSSSLGGTRIPLPGHAMELIDDSNRLISRETTGLDGKVVFRSRPKALGRAGRVRLLVRTKKTQLYNEASEQVEILLFLNSRVTLKTGRKTGRVDETIDVAGKVVDDLGPVSDGLVHVRVNGRIAASARTDKEGRYTTRLHLKEMTVGRIKMTAHFLPSEEHHMPASSPVVEFTILSARPIPMTFYTASALLTALLLLVLIGLRNRPWRHLTAFLQKRRARKVQKSGIRLGSSELRAYLGAGRHTISGQVIEAPKGPPVKGARMVLDPLSHSPAVELVSDETGRFGPCTLASGSFRLVCSSPGFLTESRVVTVPHRGELDGVIVELVSIRRRVMEIYQEVVLPMLPSRSLVDILTPSELLAHVSDMRQAAAPAMAALTEMVEKTYYSSRIPDPGAISEVQRLGLDARNVQKDFKAREAGTKPRS